MTTRVAINGFGRIGRNTFRIIMERVRNGADIEMVAINDLTTPKILAHLLKYDSVFRHFPGSIEIKGNNFLIDGEHEVAVMSQRDPSRLPWKKMKIDLVIESTGFFRDRAGASKHLSAGAGKVLISAPATKPDITLVMGVNDEMYGGGAA